MRCILICIYQDIPVTSISKRCYDKPSRVAKILITIVDGSGDHPDYSLLVFKVITQLSNPLKVVDIVDIVSRHLGYDITCCNVY